MTICNSLLLAQPFVFTATGVREFLFFSGVSVLTGPGRKLLAKFLFSGGTGREQYHEGVDTYQKRRGGCDSSRPVKSPFLPHDD